jgi:L-alanine-DL-glutamate epimerase-like enolase superfamily enzyme
VSRLVAASAVSRCGVGKDLGTEPTVPVNGRMRLPDTPGFGVELNPDVPLVRLIAR